MQYQEIIVIAELKIKKESVNEAKSLLNDLQIATKKENGCISYQLHQSIGDETKFVFYESWVDKESIDKHFETPHFKNWMEISDKFLAEPAVVTILRKVEL